MKSLFSNNISGFIPYRDYETNNDYISRKKTNISTMKRNQLNCDSFDDCVVIGMREPIPVTFIQGKFLQHREFLLQLKQYNMEKNQTSLFCKEGDFR